MKKQLLTAALSGAAMAALAQPAIQASQFNFLSAGSFTYKYQAGQTAVSPGPSGANVTWNFTSLGQGSNLSYTTAACPGDSDCGTFPGANQVLNVGTMAKLYYEKTNSALEQVGEKASGTMVYSDPMRYMQFPITFNQTYSDTYASSNGSDTRNGTVTSTIDGYGTLQTPAGTYTDVLRQKIVEHATVTTNGMTSTMILTHYYWMKADMHHYIMSIVSAEITGTPVPVPATYAVAYTTATGSVGIDAQAALAGKADIYPNPADKDLRITTDDLPIGRVEIFNILGQKLLDKNIDKPHCFSVTLNGLELNSGHYFVKISTEKGLITKQVVIR